MSYGYPPSIKDADCDVEFLDPLAKLSAGRTSTPFNAAHQSSSSLLLYKYLMSKLSVLIKDILTNLYGLGSLKGSPQQAMAGTSSGLQNLIRKVSSFEEKLREWKAERPEFLQLNSSTSGATYNSAEEMDRDVGASGSTFERHIYQLQALALELAYENAMILVHRPLLTYKTTNRMNDDRNSVDDSDHSPLRLSLLACREAALNTSEIETTLVFSLAADTYAAAFIGMHTFTAGVMLCVLTGIEPLSAQSYESKRGIRRLFTMQAHLKSRSRSVVAAQGLEILERLIRLVMEKETKEILTISAPEGFHQPTSQMTEARETEQISANNNIASLEDDTGGNAAIDYIQDPNIVQTLYDFDQVLSRSSHQSPLSETLLSETLGPSGAFAQEQAWIWGIDNFAPFPTDS
ncbi:hypothetical protein Plec18167_004364 [Paecilomyces lecythidis]|uniref:Transcription factor domain-containing protein n=1 Tax=Paecilomyces lecythidis TaxID=3004212 RepID=A0ABR3XQM7_9EURO